MNKKILAAAIAAVLVTPMAFAAYDNNADANTGTNDDAVDTQTLQITVPEVALLNVSDAILTMDTTALNEPLNAGDGFTGQATATSEYAISSNVKNISPVMREITVGIDSNVGVVPAGAKLEIAVTAPSGATNGTATLYGQSTSSATGTTTAESSATNIGNIAASNLDIDYTLDVNTSSGYNGMIAYTGTDGTSSDNIGLIYTLTDD